MMSHLSLLCAVIFILLVGSSSSSDDSVQVKIPQGILLGEWRSTFEGRKFAAFEGVPFATPPVGKRRFKEPEPPKPWNGVWVAKNSSKECIQWSDMHIGLVEDKIIGDEDCLYLNLYTPNPNASKKIAVLVYIHGGAFMLGSGTYYGPEYLLERDIILVSINYRLGPLGFLSTQDGVVPGNNGMKDQVMALKWVQENIQFFGGDPTSVTVMGMSAGGASVNYHLLSPLSKGLIHRGISESGTSCCPWTLQTRPVEKASMVASLVGCPTDSNKDMIECLRRRPAASIVRTVPHFMPYINSPFSPFALVIEPPHTKGAFLSKHPYQIIRDGEAQDLPWLNSLTTHEGIFPVGLFLQRKNDLADLESRWEELVPHIFDFNDTLPVSEHANAAEKIKMHYLKGKPVSYDTIPQLIDVFSDRHFVIDIEKCARLQASVGKQPVYLYQFGYSGQETFGKVFSLSDKKYGVSHGDCTAYIFKFIFLNAVKTIEDKQMVKMMVDMTVTFANNGVPKVGDLDWPQINAKKGVITYMEIKNPSELIVKNVRSLGSVEFWESLGLKENEKFQSTNRDEL